MKHSKVICGVICSLMLGLSSFSAIPSLNSSVNDNVITVSAKAAPNGKYGDWGASNPCPVAGYYYGTDHNGDVNRMIITSKGDIFMRNVRIGTGKNPITAQLKVTETSKYNDDTIAVSIDFSPVKALRDETDDILDLIGGSSTKEKGWYLYKNQFSLYTKAGGSLSPFNASSCMNRIADYSYNEYKKYFFSKAESVLNGCTNLRPGDVNNDGSVDITDCSFLALILVDNGSPSPSDFKNLSYMNADIDLNGKVELADLAALKQVVSKIKTKDCFLNNFMGIYDPTQYGKWEK